MGKQKGRPKNPVGWEFSVWAKIKQITSGRKITPYKAWLQITKHRNFKYLIKPHFERQKKYKMKKTFKDEVLLWEQKIQDPDWIKNFYKNNIVRSRMIKRLDDIEFIYTRRKK
jgi:hypothetical protein